MQGVGFRPFVKGLADRLGLSGFVGNDPAGVFCEVEGDQDRIEVFARALETNAPFPAVVEHLQRTNIPPRGDDRFRIVESQSGSSRTALVAADIATCAECLRELFDPADRRFRYPFINCTHCGPRFCHSCGPIPYDRANTTMASFSMCPDCARELPRSGGPAVPRPAGVLSGMWSAPGSPRLRRPAGNR